MKRRIPAAGKVAKDAKECVQECVSEFISFITSEASDRCLQEKRKTINGEDLLSAMQSLGFDAYIEPLSMYIKQYREATRADKDSSSIATSTQPTAAIIDDTSSFESTNTVAVDSTSAPNSVMLLEGGLDADSQTYRLISTATNQRHTTATTASLFVDTNGQHYISLPAENGAINFMAVHIPTEALNAQQPIQIITTNESVDDDR